MTTTTYMITEARVWESAQEAFNDPLVKGALPFFQIVPMLSARSYNPVGGTYEVQIDGWGVLVLDDMPCCGTSQGYVARVQA